MLKHELLSMEVKKLLKQLPVSGVLEQELKHQNRANCLLLYVKQCEKTVCQRIKRFQIKIYLNCYLARIYNTVIEMDFKKATANNRAYLASCLRHFAQIQPYGWTSDTLGTLDEIAALYAYNFG